MPTHFGAEPTLRTYLSVLRRRKWWIVLPGLLGLAASLSFAHVAHKQYASAAEILVEPASSASVLGAAQAPVTQTQVETELQLVSSEPVLAAVRQQIGSAPHVAVAEIGQTNVFTITSGSRDPAHAALVANAYARQFVNVQQEAASRNLTAAEDKLTAQISSVQQELKALKGKASSSEQADSLLNQQAVLKEQLAQMQVSGAENIGGVELVTPATVPTTPSSPKPLRDTLLGLVAGLIVGLCAGFFRDGLDEALMSKETAERACGAPVLALVPTVRAWRRRRKPLLVTVTDPTSPAAEAYRSLRTSLQFARQEQDVRSIMVTSPTANEGKTSTVANLGVVFAQAGARVVIVSCDLRRPRLGSFFDLDESSGLTAVLQNQLPLQKALKPVAGHSRLRVLPAGKVPTNPAELLSSDAARDTMAKLRESFDVVLIDSPPVLPITDAVVLSRYADATLMVAAAGQTTGPDLQRAAERLNQVGTRVTGAVLNQVTKWRGYGDGYGYSYKYDYKAYAPVKAAAEPRHRNGGAATPADAPRPQKQQQ